MRITESQLRSIIRKALLSEAPGDDDEIITGWKPPWEGGGSGSGGHVGDRHWADSDHDYDDYGVDEVDESLEETDEEEGDK